MRRRGADRELIDPYYVALRLGIERRCQQEGIDLAKIYEGASPQGARMFRGTMGVIVVGQLGEEGESFLKTTGKQWVYADSCPSTDEYDSVQSDLAMATTKLLDGLLACNYRNIAFIGWRESRSLSPYDELRCSTYVKWSKANSKFDPQHCLTAQNNEEGGHELTLKLMRSKNRPDAIVTGSDNMAVGAFRALRELGMDIGKDIGVASFNDISVAQFMHPSLTTVRLPAEEIGEAAVDLLVERAKGRSLGKRLTLASRIIWRNSTRRPKPAK
jgi:LacI family transcriptional regulator